MTRINCLPAEHLFDEHLAAHLKEGLRPLNKLLKGMTNIKNAPKHWKLGTGHELFHKAHLKYTVDKWLEYQKEWRDRGYTSYDWSPSPLPEELKPTYWHDYKPSRGEMRSNLARIVCRWKDARDNGKKGYKYNGVKINTLTLLREYVNMVKLENGL